MDIIERERIVAERVSISAPHSMLYQTHHSQYFFFQVQSSTTTQPKTSPLSFSPVKEMEGVLRKEMVGCEDDMWTTTTATTTTTNSQKGVSLDEFSVDDLLDFSNEDGLIEQEHTQVQTQEGENKSQNLSMTTTTEEEETQHKEDHKDEIFNFDDLGPIPVGDLDVPVDDVANLEWLSHFVEDSFSEYSAPFPAGAMPLKPKEKGSEPETPVLKTKACFRSPVPAKARSKRSRSGCRVWSLGSPPSLTDSSSGSTSSGSTSSPSSPLLIYGNHPGSVCVEPVETVSCEKKPPAKRPRKKLVAEGARDGDGCCGGATSGSSTKLERRCSHCSVHKTPQWRTGPYGPKTLCNACGVRYKSGRLLPEYRPACSPTFSSERHSNHHRKVLEMRRQKEMLGQAEPGLAAQVVPSF